MTNGPLRVLSVPIQGDTDVVAARQRARQIASMSGFATQDQARIATVVSEIARNIVKSPTGGKIEFAVDLKPNAQQLVISIEERRTSGRASVDVELFEAARRLMDECVRDASETGTTIVLRKLLPRNAMPLTPDIQQTFPRQLARLPDNMAIVDMRQQNHDLLEALQLIQSHREELLQATRALEATNERIVALNAQLDEKVESLGRADVRKDEFIAILSHELRGPLSAAQMAAHLIVSPPEQDARAIQFGNLILRQVAQMSRIVEDLLDVSRVSRGLVRLERTRMDLRDVISDAVEQVDSQRLDKGHRITIDMPDAPCWVSGDHSRLVQTVSNLLANAIRYTPAGGAITIALTSCSDHARVQVTDNGIGLDIEKIPHLFDIYVQAEHSSDRNNSGLGLGLALVKSLVELHGGSVSASSPGKGMGSTFAFLLPILIAINN